MGNLLDMLKAKELELATTFEPQTAAENAQSRAEAYNAVIGGLDKLDGYTCPRCKNKGMVAGAVEVNANWDMKIRECACMETRRTIMRMKRSGLEGVIKSYTFDKFEAREPWQKTIKAAAMEYAGNPEGWFALCGQVGSGKTHLCTAICRELLLKGEPVLYMLWRDEIAKIKQAAMGAQIDDEAQELNRLLNKYKTVKVLYIDDFFKTGKTMGNTLQRPTVADINYAFEIINYRYNNPGLRTIISTELTEDELLDIDEAIGSRIYERAKAFSIGKDRKKNYRLQGVQQI